VYGGTVKQDAGRGCTVEMQVKETSPRRRRGERPRVGRTACAGGRRRIPARGAVAFAILLGGVAGAQAAWEGAQSVAVLVAAPSAPSAVCSARRRRLAW